MSKIPYLEPDQGDVLKRSRQINNTFLRFCLRPTIDFQDSEKGHIPATIKPSNFVPPTPQELLAHQERQEIRGRLRRKYWKLAYDPVNGKYWNPNVSDPMVTRYHTARSVWHLEHTVKLSDTFRSNRFFLLGLFGLMGASVYYTLYGSFRDHERKSVVKMVQEGII